MTASTPKDSDPNHRPEEQVMRRLEYADLPQTIRSILPRNRFGFAWQVNDTVIKTQTNYDSAWDFWDLVGGKWQYRNPGSRRQ